MRPPKFPAKRQGVLLTDHPLRLCCAFYPAKLCRGDEQPGYIYFVARVGSPGDVQSLTEHEARQWFKSHAWHPGRQRFVTINLGRDLLPIGYKTDQLVAKSDLKNEAPKDEATFANRLLTTVNKKRDREAFEALHHRYNRIVLAKAWAVLENHHDAEEAAQQAWLAVYSDGAEWDGGNALQFIAGIATRTAKRFKWQSIQQRRGGLAPAQYQAAVVETLYSETSDDWRPFSRLL